MSWAVHVARVGEMRYAYRILVGKPERKEALRRSRRRWDDKLKWIFRKWDRGHTLD